MCMMRCSVPIPATVLGAALDSEIANAFPVG